MKQKKKEAKKSYARIKSEILVIPLTNLVKYNPLIKLSYTISDNIVDIKFNQKLSKKEKHLLLIDIQHIKNDQYKDKEEDDDEEGDENDDDDIDMIEENTNNKVPKNIYKTSLAKKV